MNSTLNNSHIIWKQIASLPADGKVRLVGGMEAVHHPRTAIRQACVMLHDGDEALRRVQNASGSWSRADSVSWNGGNR